MARQDSLSTNCRLCVVGELPTFSPYYNWFARGLGVVYEDFLARADLHGCTDPAVKIFLQPGLSGLSPFDCKLDELSCSFKDVRLLLLCRCWSSVWKVVFDVQRGVPRGPCEGLAERLLTRRPVDLRVLIVRLRLDERVPISLVLVEEDS